ncbi:hypothetical protein ES703_46067 [subsurface metagenome]
MKIKEKPPQTKEKASLSMLDKVDCPKGINIISVNYFWEFVKCLGEKDGQIAFEALS